MSHTPNFDAKVKTLLDVTTPGERVCPISGERWACEQEEIDWWGKFNVPARDVSPMKRRRWLTGFNLGLEMWWNKDAQTGEKILSYVHPDSKIQVVEDTRWHAEDWSTRVSVEPDASKSFFEQMRVLNEGIPVPALRTYNPPINTVGAGLISVEDSFMVFAVLKTKRSAYGWLLDGMENCQDIFFGYTSTDSFYVNHVERLHNCRIVLQSQDCFNSSFLFDCRNCEYVFGGFNLRNRQYVWWGEQLSRGEWEQRAKELDLKSWKTFSENMDRFLKTLDGEAVWPENFNIQAEDSSGEYLVRCLRARHAFGVNDGTDFYNAQISHNGCERCAHSSGFTASSDLYMVAGASSCSNMKFSSNCGTSRNLEYCMQCYNCEDCFGCVGLNRKKFCLLNKQYDEDEYWRKLDEMKCAMLNRGEYGRYLPGDFSPAGIEFSTANFFDYPERELEAIGAVHFDPSVGAVQDASSMTDPETLPDHLDDCEAYVGKPLIDKGLDRAFAVRRDDYKFYKKLGLPFPRRHYIARVRSLARMANTFTSSEHTCANCSKSVIVANNLTFKNRRVYCYGCYLEYLEHHG